MKFIRLFLIAFAFIALPAIAAQTVVLGWTTPTTRVDGTPLPVAEISGYEIYYTIDSGTQQVVSVTPGSATTKTVDLTLAPRNAPYQFTAAIATVDTKGQKSAHSASVTKSITVLPALPSAPGNFTLTITCVAGTCTLVIQ